MFNIRYFKKGNDICGDDFKNHEIEKINLDLLSSLSELKKLELPFSSKKVGDYALITMNNGDKYYIDDVTYQRLMNLVEINN